jgi:hypothetical protein
LVAEVCGGGKAKEEGKRSGTWQARGGKISRVRKTEKILIQTTV